MPRSAYNLCLLLLAVGLALAACAPTGIYHTVQPGQTLYRISKSYEVDEATIARLNDVRDPTDLRVGQRLFIPGVTQLRYVPATAAAPPPTTVSPSPPPLKSVPSPGKTVSRTTASKPAAKPSVAPPAAPTPAPGLRPQDGAEAPVKGVFIWPAKGKLLNGFGKRGEKVYKGIEIDVPSGTAVVAAAPGKVIYSGSGIPGYGNLIILEHSDNFFSVYGYNRQNLVKMDAFVGQGDRIALSGQPPGGRGPRLHFEIRKGKSAVDPILYLP